MTIFTGKVGEVVSASLFGFGVGAVFLLPQSVSAAAVGGVSLSSDTAGFLATLTSWVQESYRDAPALVLGLALLLTVPPLALVGVMFRSSARTDEGTTLRLRRGRAGSRGQGVGSGDGVVTTAPPMRGSLEVRLNDHVETYSITAPVMRIGREPDNEVCVQDQAVHRYHAVLSWSEDRGFVLTDLYSEGGNGMAVNGKVVSEAQLSDGDEIELGRAQLKFYAAAGSAGA